MKKLPIGIDNFEKIITGNYLYIDKTKFIEEILSREFGVQLFTRPRRFGKSLNMSMLKYFFDISRKEENKKLFKDLYIEKSPYFSEQGKYPVIYFSAKNIQTTSIENFERAISIFINTLFRNYEYLYDKLESWDKLIYQKYVTEKLDIEESKVALSILVEILNKVYKEKVIVLIDEYEQPLLNAYEFDYYNELVNFFKGFYGTVLKSNDKVKMGVLTGGIKVAQAGIFSDLNNLSVNTILSNEYDEYFGLLESEVRDILKKYDLEKNIETVKYWYDGYLFGNKEVYNPWSILNYVAYRNFATYWVNTSGNLMIKKMLKKYNGSILNSLQELIDGKEVEIDLNDSVVFGNDLSSNDFWELMLFSGYLTVNKRNKTKRYSVKIPNNEVKTFFKRTFVDVLFPKEYGGIIEMIKALYSNDILMIIRGIEEVLLNSSSYYDLSKKYENAYQMLFAGFFYGIGGEYTVYSNIESGHGRADLVLKANTKEYPSYIFEFKIGNKKEAKRAYEQIEEKKYDSILKKENIDNIVKIGLAFDGKKVEAYFK